MQSLGWSSDSKRAWRMRLCGGIVAALTLSSVAEAQLVPRGFATTVRVEAYFRGETLYVAHRVSNAVSSTAPVWGFVLETQVPVAAQGGQPQLSDELWVLDVDTFGGRETAEWIALGDATIDAGRSSPSLILGGIGIPGIVARWVIAYTPPPKTEDPDREPDVDLMLQRSVRGLTVGIVPVPVGATPASLATRLRGLLTRSCGELKWITQAGVCHSLDVKLEHAQSALRAGQTNVARNELSAFAKELDAQHGPQPGKHVTDAGYALLSANVTYILRHL